MTQEQNSQASNTTSRRAANPKSPYVGVTWFKQAQKWRAYITASGARVLKDGVWTRPQRFVYVGLYDNMHVAAVAREMKILNDESLGLATRNVIDPKWYVEHYNQTRDPDTSPLAPFVEQEGEVWHPIPGYVHYYQVSTAGRVAAINPWGTALVVPSSGRVVLSRNGLVQGHRVANLVQQALKST